MSRSGRPLLAGGSAVADGKNISKLSRRALALWRAADRAKLLANLAGDRAGCPASRAAGAPSTPSTPTSPQTRSSKRYALRSAEKSIAKMLAELSSPDGSAERAPSATANPLAPATSVDDDDDDDDDDDEVDDCSSGGDQRMEFQRRQRDAASSAMAQLKSPPLEVVSRWRNSRCSGELGRGSGGGEGRRVHHLEDKWRCVEGINLSDPHGAELSTQQQKTKYVSEIC